jgi:Periplasmic copper-binding protein (NosD)
MLKLTTVLSGVIILATGIYQPAPAIAQNAKPFYVGTCKPGKADFTTIQEAVTAVPSGSTIDICPGTYPEQVTIHQSVTLQGVQSGNDGSVVITAPPSGLLSAMVPVGFPVSAQVTVSRTDGPVNISGLTVDGTGITAGTSGSAVAGILYNSSSGTLNHVLMQNLAPTSTEVFGAVFRDDGSVSPTDTIQNSAVYLPNTGGGEIVGIAASTAVSGTPNHLVSSSGTITLSVSNNYISVGPSGARSFGINAELNVAATISGNTVTEFVLTSTPVPQTGFFETGIIVDFASAPIKINGNTVLDASDSIVLNGSTSSINIVNNVLAPSNTGITIEQPSGATITGNQIVPANIKLTGAPNIPVGIDFLCLAPLPTISGNIFMGTAIALSDVPSGMSLQKNAGTFINVPIVEQLCQ